MKFSEYLCYGIAKRMVIERDGKPGPGSAVIAGATMESQDRETYAGWRAQSLQAQYQDHFDIGALAGRRVLDFGCGGGHLAILAARAGAAQVVGLDLDEADTCAARRLAAREVPGQRVEFVLAADDRRAPFPDAAFDIILCFDVLEHIASIKDITAEWYRVLKPGGRVMIWWQPYYHPYGHHLTAYVPMPWAHVFFSNATLAATCNRIFQLPEYRLRYWDLDDSGRKRPPINYTAYKPDGNAVGGVNQLTIRRFEQLVRRSGLVIARAEPYAFEGPGPVQLVSRVLSRLPLAREFFTAYMIYELVRPL